MRILSAIIFAVLALTMHSCFTGIESTPRITVADVKRQHISVTPEQEFLSSVVLTPVSQWQPGKHLYVADSKISLVLSAENPADTVALAGVDLVYRGLRPVTSVMGEEVALVDFTRADTEHPVSFRTQVPYDQVADRQYFDVPFTVDRDVVEQVKSKLLGQEYYITTPLWYDASGTASVSGLRHVPVSVVDVQPGNALYPVRVMFKMQASDAVYSVYMTVGSRRTATRNFDTLFAFENPRNRYPSISDDDWALITHSKVKIGMSRDECRLALGSPATVGQRPSTLGMVEYWSFADGVYLLFEDGYLASYRR